MVFGEDGAGGGSDDDPLRGGFGVRPKCAVRGFQGGVALGGGGGELGGFVGEIGLRGG